MPARGRSPVVECRNKKVRGMKKLRAGQVMSSPSRFFSFDLTQFLSFAWKSTQIIKNVDSLLPPSIHHVLARPISHPILPPSFTRHVEHQCRHRSQRFIHTLNGTSSLTISTTPTAQSSRPARLLQPQTKCGRKQWRSAPLPQRAPTY